MTDKDLNRIEAELGIALPPTYRQFMIAHAAELKGLTHEIHGVTYGWFDDFLFLEPDRVIEVNQIERLHDAGTGYAFPNWWTTYFLIGTNGAGDYYCLRLDGDEQVWMIGSDCGDEPSVMSPSLSEQVESRLREYRAEHDADRG